MIASLRLAPLDSALHDASNRFQRSDAAARLGRAVFFDAGMSRDGSVSCSTCHRPDLSFQDGLPVARGVGLGHRRTMSVVGTSWNQWFLWDGRKDSQWAQALGPFENPVEHGVDRTFVVRRVASVHGRLYREAFGALPPLGPLPAHAGPLGDPDVRAAWLRLSQGEQARVNRVFANVGKSLAAYQFRLRPGSARFDEYATLVVEGRQDAARSALSQDEEAGLRVFLGKGQCVRCHNGPMFTDHFFHNTGVSRGVGEVEDLGRLDAIEQVLQDEFNCRSAYSDAGQDGCASLDFMLTEGPFLRAFKTPSLRDVVARPPYMHAGQLSTLESVLDHYNRAPRAPLGRSELVRLRLTAAEQRQLVAFLGTLDGGVAAPAEMLEGAR